MGYAIARSPSQLATTIPVFRVSDIVQIVAYRIRGVAKMPYPHVGRAILPAAVVYRRAHKQEPPRKAAAARIVCPTFVNQL
jgi:hypothetical protein